MDSKTWHRLSEVNRETRTATCSVCGPAARIRIRPASANHRPECLTARLSARCVPPATRRRAYIRDRYGVEPDAIEQLAIRQGGVCAICGAVGDLQVDHDHACCNGRYSCGACIRGLLCGRCNRGLGWFNDDVGALRAAIDYLVNARTAVARA